MKNNLYLSIGALFLIFLPIKIFAFICPDFTCENQQCPDKVQGADGMVWYKSMSVGVMPEKLPFYKAIDFWLGFPGVCQYLVENPIRTVSYQSQENLIHAAGDWWKKNPNYVVSICNTSRENCEFKLNPK